MCVECLTLSKLLALHYWLISSTYVFHIDAKSNISITVLGSIFAFFCFIYVIRASKRRYYQIGAYNFHNYHRLRKTEWDMKAKYLQTLRATDKRWGLWNCRANGTDARSLWDGSIWGCHVWTKTPNICLYPFRFVSIWIFI